MSDRLRWWHYTVWPKLREILEDQQIRRATACVPRGERPVVWFTSRPMWEPTASAGRGGRMATIAEMVGELGPLVRIEVSPETARHTMAHHRRMGGIDLRMADILEQSARRLAPIRPRGA
jgi:hypothetical protein